MSNNYPPGFTQSDHDKAFSQPLECCKCGKKSHDEHDFLFNPEDDSIWCYPCNELAEQEAIDKQKET
jgi:hypothetical protein